MKFSLPSVGALVRSKLSDAIALCPASANVTHSLPSMPLTLDHRSCQVRYRCAIAQRLTALDTTIHRSPLEWATEIATVWTQHAELQGQTLAKLTTTPNASLDLEITDQTIATWLQGLAQAVPQSRSSTSLAGSHGFAVYYALDRCDSLITAAEQEGWFNRHNLTNLTHAWCNSDGQLRLALDAECRAIVRLVQATDALSMTSKPANLTQQHQHDRRDDHNQENQQNVQRHHSPHQDQHQDQDQPQSDHHPPDTKLNPGDRQKLIDRLAADFEMLHRHSRPWHAHRTHETATATARLGLYLGYANTLHTLINSTVNSNP